MMLNHGQACKRLHVIACLALCSLLFVCYHTSRLTLPKNLLTSIWAPSGARLVVFGDSFSHPNTIVNPIRGPTWAEVVCTELRCSKIDNLAPASKPTSPNVSMTEQQYDRIGAAAFNEIYGNTTFENEQTVNHLLPDFAKQVQEWIEVDKARSSLRRNEDVVFAAFFGLWDLWQFMTLSVDDAQRAIACSIYEIFSQLNILLEYNESKGSASTILLPQIWDLTFTPRYTVHLEAHTESAEHFADEQRKMVHLVAWWNGVLREMAVDYPWSEIYMPAWNEWVMKQIRVEQMFELGMTTQAPAVRDVHDPCWRMTVEPREDEGQNMVVQQCAEPKQSLFWDDMHLGPTAHRALGQQAALMLRHGELINAAVRSRNLTEEGQRGLSLVTYIPGLSSPMNVDF